MQQPYIFWQADGMWIGYLEAYPDYWTQGESEDELKENLLDLYHDLTQSSIPQVRQRSLLEVA